MTACVVCALTLAQSPQTKQEALGYSLLNDRIRHTPRLDDANLTQYLQRLLDRVKPSPGAELQVRLELIRDMEGREADPLPGGYVLVPLGAITNSGSESELAGVLAHGLAHLTIESHTVTRSQRSPAQIPIYWTIQHTRQQLVPLAARHQQRLAEIESDKLASVWLAQSGFDPQHYRAYVGRFGLQSVPDRTQTISLAPQPETRFETGNFPAIQDLARAIEIAARPPRLPSRPPTLRRTQ